MLNNEKTSGMRLYDRVTQVLAPFSGLLHIDKGVLKNAGDRGTVVHKICDSLILNLGKFDLEYLVEEYCRNDEHASTEKNKVEKLINSFEKWFRGKKFIQKPSRLFDDELLITGECDQIYKDEVGNNVLVDFKTSSKESKTWLLQGSAYKYLAEKNGFTIDRIEFIHLSKTGNSPRVIVYEPNFSLFKSCLDAYRYCFKEKSEEVSLDYL